MKLKLCDQIKIAQKQSGTTNKDLAALLGISPINFCRRMSLNRMQASEIDKICDYLNLEILIINKK